MSGERGGTRTHDPMIKSHVLYRLSYALTCAVCRCQVRVGQVRDRITLKLWKHQVAKRVGGVPLRNAADWPSDSARSRRTSKVIH